MGEENTNTNATVGTEAQAQSSQDSTKAQAELSVEERLAELLAENKRLKRASDKASSEAADYKKQLMASKSDSERAAMEKAERDAALQEELQALRKESAVNRFAKSFMGLGYSEKNAMAAAEAQYSGDYDELNRLQADHQANMEKKIRAELMKSMPAPSIGNDDSITVTQAQFDNMGYAERVKLFNEHPTVYAKLAK